MAASKSTRSPSSSNAASKAAPKRKPSVKPKTKSKAKARPRSKPKSKAGGGTKTLLVRIRGIVSEWPEVDERISHGSPTFWGGKKTFASFHDHHHGDGRVALWIKSDKDTQEGLADAEPEFFFVPPYVGPSGWIGVCVDGAIDWDVVAGLLEDGYRSVAPKRALAILDERASGLRR